MRKRIVIERNGEEIELLLTIESDGEVSRAQRYAAERTAYAQPIAEYDTDDLTYDETEAAVVEALNEMREHAHNRKEEYRERTREYYQHLAV